MDKKNGKKNKVTEWGQNLTDLLHKNMMWGGAQVENTVSNWFSVITTAMSFWHECVSTYEENKSIVTKAHL